MGKVRKYTQDLIADIAQKHKYLALFQSAIKALGTTLDTYKASMNSVTLASKSSKFLEIEGRKHNRSSNSSMDPPEGSQKSHWTRFSLAPGRFHTYQIAQYRNNTLFRFESQSMSRRVSVHYSLCERHQQALDGQNLGCREFQIWC
jgi:hypothetical protein